MNQLYLMLGAGGLLLLLFLAALIFHTASVLSREPAVAHVPSMQMLRLPGLSFPHGPLLFHRGDYEFLLSGPSVAGVARQLLRDRKRLVNMWLRALQSDILTLWRFRRLLLQHGATASPAEEISVAFSAVSLLTLLMFLRVGVILFGPFALVDVLRAAPRPAEFVRHTCFRLAAQLPDTAFAQVRTHWQSA